MSDKKEVVFAKGVYVEKPSERAPDFVIAKMSFHMDTFMMFMESNLNKAGYVNCDILMSKDGQKYYAVLNQFEPKKPESLQEEATISMDDDESSVPF